MTTKVLRLLLAFALFAFTSVAFAQNLVQNGGFETGDFTDWTLSGDTTLVGVCSVETCPGGYMPFDGTYSAYFGPVGDTATISQMIPTTPGDTYSLSFYLANPVGGTPNYFQASLGTASFSFTNFGVAFNWQQFTLSTVATSDETQLSFTFRNDPAYWFLDDVSVTQSGGGTVPEPSSMILFGSGVLGIVGLARRKFRL